MRASFANFLVHSVAFKMDIATDCPLVHRHVFLWDCVLLCPSKVRNNVNFFAITVIKPALVALEFFRDLVGACPLEHGFVFVHELIKLECIIDVLRLRH